MTLDEPNRDQVVKPVGEVESRPEVTLTTWISDLRARGVTFSLRGNRLVAKPWRLLATDDRAALRTNREPIKQLIRAGLPDLPTIDPGVVAAERDAQLKTQNPSAWQVLHFHDPAEVERRRADRAAAMFSTLWRTSPYL